jgi:hypothetical protein
VTRMTIPERRGGPCRSLGGAQVRVGREGLPGLGLGLRAPGHGGQSRDWAVHPGTFSSSGDRSASLTRTRTGPVRAVAARGFPPPPARWSPAAARAAMPLKSESGFGVRNSEL